MALTPSNMVPLGSSAPAFELIEPLSGNALTLSSVKGNRGTLVMFICNHCPYVKHVAPLFGSLAKEYLPKGIGMVAINANDVVAYPEDSPENMKSWWLSLGNPFPYVFDETQEVARAYDAACTPDVYLFDDQLKLAYRGQLDSSRPGNAHPLDGKDIRNALDAILSGNTVNPFQRPAVGCNIKWKANGS